MTISCTSTLHLSAEEQEKAKSDGFNLSQAKRIIAFRQRHKERVQRKAEKKREEQNANLEELNQSKEKAKYHPKQNGKFTFF